MFRGVTGHAPVPFGRGGAFLAVPPPDIWTRDTKIWPSALDLVYYHGKSVKEVAKIIKGARPADLPVERASK
jgi:hypothetical protein